MRNKDVVKGMRVSVLRAGADYERKGTVLRVTGGFVLVELDAGAYHVREKKTFASRELAAISLHA